jgi:hypothetical protein
MNSYPGAVFIVQRKPDQYFIQRFAGNCTERKALQLANAATYVGGWLSVWAIHHTDDADSEYAKLDALYDTVTAPLAGYAVAGSRNWYQIPPDVADKLREFIR